MNESLKLQAKIRENAKALQEYSSDLLKWESSIKAKDANLRQKHKSQSNPTAPQPPPPRRPPSSPTSTSNSSSSSLPEKKRSAADHTYDKGYRKWESFDVDSALKELDDNEENSLSNSPNRVVEKVVSHGEEVGKHSPAKPNAPLTPATIVAPFVNQAPAGTEKVAAFPDAKPQEVKPRDVLEREQGNEYFKKGNMEQAVKYYTRAIGFNPNSVVAYSNRAMAYLKLNDHLNAELDCCAALRLDPVHVKTLMRRGTARNGLGRHKAALCDFLRASELEPGNKQAIAQSNRTREFVKNSVRKAPKRTIPLKGVFDTVSELSSGQAEQSSVEANAQNVVKSEAVLPPENKSTVSSSQELLESSGSLNKQETSKATTVSQEGSSKEQMGEEPVGSTSNSLVVDAGLLSQKSKVRERLLKQVPKTLYEFTKLWKELQGSPALQAELLTAKLGKVGISKVFRKEAPEPDLLMEMLMAVESGQHETDVAQTVEALFELDGIEMITMFLSKEDKLFAGQVVGRCCSILPSSTSLKRALERLRK